MHTQNVATKYPQYGAFAPFDYTLREFWITGKYSFKQFVSSASY